MTQQQQADLAFCLVLIGAWGSADWYRWRETWTGPLPQHGLARSYASGRN